MSTSAIVFLITGLVAIVVIALLAYQQQKSKKLREQFGPEYTRAVREAGSTSRAEAKLSQMKKRVQEFKIRPLSADESRRLRESWRAVQARFVDQPQGAVLDADALLKEVMTARGYPVNTFEQCAEDLSVDHPLIVEHYRAGHALCVNQAQGHVTTEDLRQAMIHYRALFDELTRDTAMAVRRAG